jgi:hypothetical protein
VSFDQFPEAERNKVNLTTEQQAMLERALSMATCAANIFTCMVSPEMQEQDTVAEMARLSAQVKSYYTKGPMQFIEELREITRFCDLPTAFSVKRPDGSYI